MNEHNYELESAGLRLVIKHINKVQGYISDFIYLLTFRLVHHDQSKYSPNEIGLVLGKSAFDKFEYMSKEERAALDAVKESVVYHYQNNPHHPEHYENGIDDMSLIDLVEMFCDWKAASESSKDGNIQNSIDFNKERFGISPQLVKILENTAHHLGWE